MITRALSFLVVSLAILGCEDADPEPRYTLDDVNATAGETESWSFDEDAAGGLPADASSFVGNWAVRAEDGAPSDPNALCQSQDEDYPALRLGSRIYGDGTFTTRFKPISGETDQAAGILFRVQDQDNYYILRANALEANVAFYIYGDGGREQMGEDGEVDVATGEWQELKVVVREDQFTAFLNGSEVLTHSDDNYVAGSVGLWTKADSHTCFDDVLAVAE